MLNKNYPKRSLLDIASKVTCIISAILVTLVIVLNDMGVISPSQYKISSLILIVIFIVTAAIAVGKDRDRDEENE